jgi:hypothetical protein
MKEEDFVIGAIVGGVLLVSQREQEQEQKHPITVTKSLIPFTSASLDPTEPLSHTKLINLWNYKKQD